MKGASAVFLKIVERELHEAWRQGREEARREFAESAVAEIVEGRFGVQYREAGAALARLIHEEELMPLVVLAAICSDFNTFAAIAAQRNARQMMK